MVASGSEDTSVRLWDIQSGACLHKLMGHDAMVISVSVATESNHVVSVATDDRLCVWESISGNLLHCLQLVSVVQCHTHLQSVMFLSTCFSRPV